MAKLFASSGDHDSAASNLRLSASRGISRLKCVKLFMSKGLNTFGRFSAIFTRETTFVTSCLLCCTLPILKKGLLPTESKCFRFIVDPF